MSTESTTTAQLERRLRIAGRLIEKALQDVHRAKHCVTLVSQYSTTSDTSDRIKSEEIRVTDILTTGARKDLAKALSILNSATSEARLNTRKRPD